MDDQLKRDVITSLVKQSLCMTRDEANNLLTRCNGNAWLASTCVRMANAAPGISPHDVADAVEAYVAR